MCAAREPVISDGIHSPERKNDSYQKAFDLYDTDGDGFLTFRDIAKAMRSLGHDVEDKELANITSEISTQKNHSWSFEDFVQIIDSWEASQTDGAELVEVFRVLDQDGDGFISKSDIREILRRLGDRMNPPLSPADIEDMFKMADQDGDGQVNYEEFIKMMLAQYD